jgi:triphosphatase
MKRRRQAGSMAPPGIIENTAAAQFLLRFIVPAHALDALTAAIRAEEAHAQRCQSNGFDTLDGRLAARGVFLSLCKRGREWVQIAVATTPDCARLLVHEVDLGTQRGGSVPAILAHLHDGSEAGAALRAAMGGAFAAAEGSSPLLVSYAIDATRLTRAVRMADAIVEIAQVTGTITTNDAAVPIREFEVRLVSGPLASLFALAQDWSMQHGLSLSTVSNGERGARLAAGHPDGLPTTAALPQAPFIDGADFAQATLDSCLAQILANASILDDGAQNRHVIDQLRDGLERIRTTIAELSPMASDMDDAWEPVLRRTFHELASHRSTTALRAPLIQEMRAAGLAYALGSSHPRETRSPDAIVRDPEFQSTLMAILAYRHTLAPMFRPDKGSLRQLQHRLGAQLARCQGKVEGDADNLRSTPKRRRASRHLEALSRLATFAAPLYDARQGDRFLVRCRVAQDAFTTDGEHRSGLEAIEDDRAGGAAVKLARRWLTLRLDEDRRQCEALLHRVGKATAFWA